MAFLSSLTISSVATAVHDVRLNGIPNQHLIALQNGTV